MLHLEDNKFLKTSRSASGSTSSTLRAAESFPLPAHVPRASRQADHEVLSSEGLERHIRESFDPRGMLKVVSGYSKHSDKEKNEVDAQIHDIISDCLKEVRANASVELICKRIGHIIGPPLSHCPETWPSTCGRPRGGRKQGRRVRGQGRGAANKEEGFERK